MRYLFYCPSPIGQITLAAENDALTHLRLPSEPVLEGGIARETPLLREAGKQLAAYFAGERREFALPLAPQGTPFQQSCWQELLQIPYGETRSYGQIARAIANPKACRAVGMANNRNPIAILIPCHRVIGAQGDLVGYGGGLAIKQFLLNLEKATLETIPQR